MPERIALAQLERFATEVMPAFKRATAFDIEPSRRQRLIATRQA